MRRWPVKAAVLAGLVLLVAGGLHCASRAGTDFRSYGSDFNVYYFAAREVASGSDPYSRSLGPWVPYLYPPLLAEALIPLALAPLPVAAFLWFLINAASVLVAAGMCARMCEGEQESGSGAGMGCRVAATLGLLVVGRFILDSLNLGQVNPLVAALATAHVYFYWKGRKRLSAVAIAAAIAIKLTPGVLLFYHVARGRWRFAAASAGLASALILAGFVPFGSASPAVFTAFVNRTIRNGQGFDLSYAGNQSLRGVEARLLGETGDDAGKTGSLPVVAVEALMLGAAIFSARAAKGEMASSAPFFCCSVLFSPLSWKAHFVMLLLPAASLASGITGPGRSGRYALGTVLLCSFLLFTATSPVTAGLEAAEWADAHSLVAAGAAMMFAASVLSGVVKPRFLC